MTPTGLMTTANPVEAFPSIIVQDDAGARCLLQRAQGMLQKWPEGFGGFRGAIRCRTTGQDVCGSVRVTPAVGVEIDVAAPAVDPLVAHTLAEIVEARTPRFFKDGDGRFPVTFDGQPASRRVIVHRDCDTVSYRLDGAGRIVDVTRTTDRAHVVTAFEEYARAMPGRVLSARSVTAVSELPHGSLLQTEVVVDRHVRVDHVWLPLSRCITITRLDDTRTLLIELDHHELV